MRVGRALGVVVAIAALLAMTVHYGAAAEAHDPYPTAADLATDYGAHVGEEFFAWMVVVDTDDGTLVVADTLNRTIVLRAGPAPPGVQSGDVVQVYGVLEPGERVAPRRVVVSPQRDRAVMFVLSALAGVLALAFFAREWTVDWERYAVVPREGGSREDRDG